MSLSGSELLQVVRGGLVARGTTLRQECMRRGKSQNWGRQVLLSTSLGPAALKFRGELLKASGVDASIERRAA